MNTPYYMSYTSVPSDFMFEVDEWLVFKDRDTMACVPWLVVHQTKRVGSWVTDPLDLMSGYHRIPDHIRKRVAATINLIDP